MKTLVLAFAAASMTAGVALADNPAIDSDDNTIYNVQPQVERTAPIGSTFGGFKPAKLGVSVNAIDSDDNQIYNVR